ARLSADWADQHKLVATPLLGAPVGEGSIDVRLGNKFIVFERTETPSIRTLDREIQGRRVQRQLEVGWGRRFVLHPQELVLASTLEYIVLPGDLAAQVVTRSSYGRMGLICATAVQVHPHYRGCLTLELLNLGVAPLEIAPGERVAQLIFWEILPPVPVPAEPDRTCPTAAEFSRPMHAHGDDRVLADILAESDVGSSQGSDDIPTTET
ncbi:MAG: dCTP deaminase, partial [Candidatus Dormiibacterota bacterium]